LNRLPVVCIGAYVLVGVFADTARAAEVPLGVFSLGNATIGVITLDDVRKTYGPADSKRVSREEEANITICYEQVSSTSEAYIEFESGVMGGYDRITGYRIARIAPRAGCSPTKADVENRGQITVFANIPAPVFLTLTGRPQGGGSWRASPASISPGSRSM